MGTSKLITFDDWKASMTKDIIEYVEQNQMSFDDWKAWRISAWNDICLEFSGNSITDFECVLDDPHWLRAIRDTAPCNCIRVPEIRNWIKKRVKELKTLEETTEFEEVWEFKGEVDLFGHTLVMQ